MRWLIVGPYPPEQGSGAAAAAAMVAERLTAGDSVHAVSPRPSAAHDHRSLQGIRAMWAVARMARAERADGLWVRIEPGILLRAGTDRRHALLEHLALAALLRRFDVRVLDVGDVGLLPGGRAGRPVLAAATQLVTHSDKDTATLLANGAPAAHLVQHTGPADAGMSPTASPEPLGPVVYPAPTRLRDLPSDRAGIEAAVRARAQELQDARAAATEST